MYSFSLKNFKSYENATLKLDNVTVLVGANASGKSNLIEALQLTAWIAQGRRLSDLAFAAEKQELNLRGTLENLLLDPQKPVEFVCDTFGYNRVKNNPPKPVLLTLSLSLEHTDNHLLLNEEQLQLFYLHSDTEQSRASDTILYRTEGRVDGGSDLAVAYNNFKKGKNPQILCNDQQAVFTQLQTPARFGNGHEKASEVIPYYASYVQNNLLRSLFLDPHPARMRGYAFPTKRLQSDGANVSGVLHEICKDPQQKQVLLGFVQQLPEQQIRDIDFLRGPRGEAMVALEETFGEVHEKREAAILSDGTLRVLTIAAALLSVEEGSLVVIEEIDNGVHPSRSEQLLASIQTLAEAKNLRVLVTTHNPALLDALPSKMVPNVVFCFRDPQTGQSRLVKMEEIQDYSSLIAQGPLGALLTRRLIDKFVKHPKSDEDRRQQNKTLIDSLRAELP